MVTHKHVDKIISVIVALTVIICFAAMVCADKLKAYAGDVGVTMEYESKLFDTDAPIAVNIIMDGAEWEKMLSSAMQEEYYQCDVQVDGQTFYRVGIRPKGNTSLSAIATNPDTDRYSFKLEFDQYVEGQTCYGLDKLVLNNNYADATNMKEAFVYDMYRYIGANASLYNYAAVYVNGEYWGVYIALEAVEDSFMLRNFGVADGNLYKPENMGMGNRGGADRGGGFGGPSMGGNGSNLNYSGDDPDNYSAIWDGEVAKTNKADHKRVVKALKNISEGTDLEKYMDIDNLLRYMAVHVFSVNSDSLTGMMAHNYYLYEKNGQLNMLPWDYNLALGGMAGGENASGTINDAIDGAFTGTKFSDTLMENEVYYDRYHEYLRQLVDGYIGGGEFDEFYTRTRGILDEAVKTDPTAFYSYDEYADAADTFYEVVKLRGQSVSGQLDGVIPATESGQRRDSINLIDTGNLDLSIMGSMDMGNGAMGGGGGFKGFGGGFDFGGGFVGGERPEGGGPPEGFDPSQVGEPPQFGGEMPEGFDPSQAGEPPQFGGEMPEGFDPSQFGGEIGGEDDTTGGKRSPGSERPDRENKDFGGFSGSDQGRNSNSAVMKNLLNYGISFAVMAVAFVFVMRFQRKSRRK